MILQFATLTILAVQPALETPATQTAVSDQDKQVEEKQISQAENANDIRDYRSEPVPIIVTGTAESKAKKVIVGSRIPRKSLHTGGQFATNTALHGLTPGSGMDPSGNMGAGVRKIVSRGCKADDETIGSKAACLLLNAQNNFANDDLEDGIGILRALAINEAFSSNERLASAKLLYAKSEEISDEGLRLHALELMVKSGALPQSDDASARRTIAALALKSDMQELAIEALRGLDESGGSRAQDLANLAILERRADTGNDLKIMARAIAMLEENGKTAPRSWQDFISPPS